MEQTNGSCVVDEMTSEPDDPPVGGHAEPDGSVDPRECPQEGSAVAEAQEDAAEGGPGDGTAGPEGLPAGYVPV